MHAARPRALLMAFIGFGVGLLMLALTAEFLAFQCALLLAVGLAGGMAAAQPAVRIDLKTARGAGGIGGLYAALGYALPFMGYWLLQWWRLDDAGVGRRLAALTPGELAQMQTNNITPGYDYFAAQAISYVFGFMLMAMIAGWIAGAIGGAVIRSRVRA
jgi:hypothetical protein